ncbi:hypothetical protein [Conservatibacter flavescens]|uniref:Uncharacterized protein n=1 Tax=Conservatibacter flavescens TaxID=28161 RepID=A0A2M8S0X3_9PAST|nr:hypothetical protein [Conservatibacter flavescens]PJG84802.1 hypothetical protein CVP05_09705 [Conservatibacter flavescens]
MDTLTKIIFIYTIIIILLIMFVAIVDKYTSVVFFNKLESLLKKGTLNEVSLIILIHQTKVKRYYVFYTLRKLYLMTLLNDIKEHQDILLKLIRYYESEVDLVNLPNNLKKTIKLLQPSTPSALIKQLTDEINTLYLSDKKHKICNLILGGAGVFLTIISFIQNYYKIF